MNFTKTSKFSVKGIDTTRYISNALCEKSPQFNRKEKLTHFEPTQSVVPNAFCEGFPYIGKG